MLIRKATERDIAEIARIYDEIHTEEEAGRVTIGWIRGIYPTENTASQALGRGDLFAALAGDELVGAAIINQQQVDVYVGGCWEDDAPADEVMVLHTLVISPRFARMGYGKAFVKYYETYALAHGCQYLRMDTNAKNKRARALYKRMGYREAGMVPCVFNGIEGVQLVLLEKKL